MSGKLPSWRPRSEPPSDVVRILNNALERAELERLSVELAIAWRVHGRRHEVRRALPPSMLTHLDALERHTRRHPRRKGPDAC